MTPADQIPEFETADRKGVTNTYSGTVGTGWTAIPAVPGSDIQSFEVQNDSDNVITGTLEVSLDGGSTILDKLYPSGSMAQTIKGFIKQVYIRGGEASVAYRIMLNTEPT